MCGPVCAKCQNRFAPQLRYNKTIQYYKMCEACRPIKTNIDIDINYDKFNKLITDIHQSIETHKQVLTLVEGERSSNNIPYSNNKFRFNQVKSKK